MDNQAKEKFFTEQPQTAPKFVSLINESMFSNVSSSIDRRENRLIKRINSPKKIETIR